MKACLLPGGGGSGGAWSEESKDQNWQGEEGVVLQKGFLPPPPPKGLASRVTGDTASPERVLLPLLNTFKAGLNSPTSPAGPPESLLTLSLPVCLP